MKAPRNVPAKRFCVYSERIKRLNHLLIRRAVDGDESNNQQIDKLRADIDYFEYGIK